MIPVEYNNKKVGYAQMDDSNSDMITITFNVEDADIIKALMNGNCISVVSRGIEHDSKPVEIIIPTNIPDPYLHIEPFIDTESNKQSSNVSTYKVVDPNGNIWNWGTYDEMVKYIMQLERNNDLI